MSWLGDVWDFEKFNAGEMWDKIKKNPERVLIGAADPFSSKVWGGILGKDYEPIVDQWGGASKDVYAKAQDKGINTGPGATMHGIARTIASIYAGGAAGNAMSGAGAASGGAAGGAQGGTGLLSSGATAAEGMGGGSGLSYGAAGQGLQAGSAASNIGLLSNASAAGEAGAASNAAAGAGMLDKMKTAYGYVKPIGQAASTANSVRGLVAPSHAPLQAPQIMQSPGVGAQALTQLSTSNQQPAIQQMQQEAQLRAQRRNMYRGGY